MTLGVAGPGAPAGGPTGAPAGGPTGIPAGTGAPIGAGGQLADWGGGGPTPPAAMFSWGGSDAPLAEAWDREEPSDPGASLTSLGDGLLDKAGGQGQAPCQ